MESLVLFLPFLLIMGGFMYVASRRQKRAMQATIDLHDSLEPGDRVHTTSGMQATVVAFTDDTVDLEIAPGVVTTWMKLAIRDRILPEDADELVRTALAGPSVWGRFDVRFTDDALPLVAATMNLRSRLSGIATGDQAMFVTRDAFARAGGFPEIALMEDIALSANLKQLSRPVCLRARVTTSPRRWRAHGTLRTILTMWRLRLAFFLGADPKRLARAYGHGGN